MAVDIVVKTNCMMTPLCQLIKDWLTATFLYLDTDGGVCEDGDSGVEHVPGKSGKVPPASAVSDIGPVLHRAHLVAI